MTVYRNRLNFETPPSTLHLASSISSFYFSIRFYTIQTKVAFPLEICHFLILMMPFYATKFVVCIR